ncbi:hypothetical protein D3C79_962530 [compost metagenome]
MTGHMITSTMRATANSEPASIGESPQKVVKKNSSQALTSVNAPEPITSASP